MKVMSIVLGILLVIGASFLLFNKSGDRPETVATTKAGPFKQVVLSVEGMYCGGCAVSVKTALKKLEGVQDAKVDVEKARAVVDYVEGKVTVEQMIQAVEKVGYKAGKPS